MKLADSSPSRKKKRQRGPSSSSDALSLAVLTGKTTPASILAANQTLFLKVAVTNLYGDLRLAKNQEQKYGIIQDFAKEIDSQKNKAEANGYRFPDLPLGSFHLTKEVPSKEGISSLQYKLDVFYYQREVLLFLEKLLATAFFITRDDQDVSNATVEDVQVFLGICNSFNIVCFLYFHCVYGEGKENLPRWFVTQHVKGKRTSIRLKTSSNNEDRQRTKLAMILKVIFYVPT